MIIGSYNCLESNPGQAVRQRCTAKRQEEAGANSGKAPIPRGASRENATRGHRLQRTRGHWIGLGGGYS
jgi:hypothetical protein